jgi:hypothetical protein
MTHLFRKKRSTTIFKVECSSRKLRRIGTSMGNKMHDWLGGNARIRSVYIEDDLLLGDCIVEAVSSSRGGPEVETHFWNAVCCKGSP